jgi:hypothetical protein
MFHYVSNLCHSHRSLSWRHLIIDYDHSCTKMFYVTPDIDKKYHGSRQVRPASDSLGRRPTDADGCRQTPPDAGG